MSLLTIIIVNYNGRQFLDDCLRSIINFVTCPYEVVLVDNASVDDSVQFVRANHPGVMLVSSAVNTGFTGGNNIGVQHARGEWILLLNNDTVLQSDLHPALAEFADPSIGVVGARLFYADGRYQPSVGYEHTPLRSVLSWLGLKTVSWLPSSFRRVEESEGFYGQRQPHVAWVSGACLFTRKSLWEKLGGLDERYFMYLEDVDFCRQVRESGFRVVYTPEVRVTHFEGAGRPWLGSAALSRSMSSYMHFTQKYYGALSTVVMRVVLAAVMYARSLVYALQHLRTPSAVLDEKTHGYRAAAKLLLRGIS